MQSPALKTFLVQDRLFPVKKLIFLGKLEKASFPLDSKFSSGQENTGLTLSVNHGLRGKFRASRYIHPHIVYMVINNYPHIHHRRT